MKSFYRRFMSIITKRRTAHDLDAVVVYGNDHFGSSSLHILLWHSLQINDLAVFS